MAASSDFRWADENRSVTPEGGSRDVDGCGVVADG